MSNKDIINRDRFAVWHSGQNTGFTATKLHFKLC
uniref:Uncharacterized protein n=1 Tax=Anguilla anguilla TaxID=7936 RepID=A0A0E9S7Y8_ANGAN